MYVQPSLSLLYYERIKPKLITILILTEKGVSKHFLQRQKWTLVCLWFHNKNLQTSCLFHSQFVTDLFLVAIEVVQGLFIQASLP